MKTMKLCIKKQDIQGHGDGSFSIGLDLVNKENVTFQRIVHPLFYLRKYSVALQQFRSCF